MCCLEHRRDTKADELIPGIGVARQAVAGSNMNQFSTSCPSLVCLALNTTLVLLAPFPTYGEHARSGTMVQAGAPVENSKT